MPSFAVTILSKYQDQPNSHRSHDNNFRYSTIRMTYKLLCVIIPWCACHCINNRRMVCKLSSDYDFYIPKRSRSSARIYSTSLNRGLTTQSKGIGRLYATISTLMKPLLNQILTRLALHQLPFLCPTVLPSHFCPGVVRVLLPTVSALCLSRATHWPNPCLRRSVVQTRTRHVLPGMFRRAQARVLRVHRGVVLDGIHLRLLRIPLGRDYIARRWKCTWCL